MYEKNDETTAGCNRNIESNLPVNPKSSDEEKRNVKRVSILLCLILFLTSLCGSILDIFKDLCIMSRQTASSSYFTKLIIALPMSVILMLVIQNLLTKITFFQVYNLIITLFIVLFLTFGLLLLPFQEQLQKGRLAVIDLCCDGKAAVRGISFLGPIYYILCEWIYTFAYTISELYNTIMISFIFFTFANSVCTAEVNERIFPWFSSITAVSMVFSVILLYVFQEIMSNVEYKTSLYINSGLFCFMSIVCVIIYFIKLYIEKNFHKPTEVKKVHKKKTNDDWTLIFRSKFLFSMCTMTLSYGINSSFIEASFKNSISSEAKYKNEPIEKYSKKYFLYSMVIVALAMLTVNLTFLRMLKRGGAVIGFLLFPIVSFLSVIGVIGISIYNYPTETTKGLILHDKLVRLKKYYSLENWLGVIFISANKVLKFTLFDASKEIITMNLPTEYRYRYKGFYDGLCVRVGKTFTSLIIIVTTISNVDDIRKLSPFTIIIFSLLCIVWLKAGYFVMKKYLEAARENRYIDVKSR